MKTTATNSCVCVGVKFEMTAPVLVEVPEEVKMWEPAIYTLSFLLPSAYQEHPPTPTNDKVRVTKPTRHRSYCKN